ncbi:MAG: helix-turn-helix transcriptional regulator [Rikenellaceae bacterium]|nr:helix-turn-helix transcriptional regulator [Rikenellaceae bacterium]
MPKMKKPTITTQDAIRVIEHIVWLCNNALAQQSHKLIQTLNPFESFEEEFAHSKITLTEMAEQCNMCPSTFKRKFIEYYGLPPHKWQLRHRLNRAVALLQSTNLLMKQIAYECGFSTPSHFVRCFKKEFGCTPEEFRRRNK